MQTNNTAFAGTSHVTVLRLIIKAYLSYYKIIYDQCYVKGQQSTATSQTHKQFRSKGCYSNCLDTRQRFDYHCSEFINAFACAVN